jgi:hypothetical protein
VLLELKEQQEQPVLKELKAYKAVRELPEQLVSKV